MPNKARQLLLFWLLRSLAIIVKQANSKEGPTYFRCYTGENALFRWNATDKGGILYASWGIKVGDIAYPQFISVRGYNNTVNINTKLEESLRKRVYFFGNLEEGRAWFNLSSLTINDTNEYIVSISVDGANFMPYYVQLNVTEKRKVIPAKGPSDITIDRVDNVIWLSSVVSFVGQNVTLMWNTTNNSPIKSAIFGISHEGLADPQFINVNTLTEKVHHNPRISKAYAGRVDFVGNLTSGWAWFRIKNLRLNDTNEYLARITIDVDTVKSYPVRLTVRRPKEIQAKKDNHLVATVHGITTTGKRKSPLNESETPSGTTSTPPVQSLAIHIEYILLSAMLFLMLVFALICVLYLKKRKRSIQGKQHDNYEITKEDICSKSLLNINNKEDNILDKNNELENIIP